MKRTRLCVIDVALWCFVVYLLGHMPTIEMRVDELEQAAQKYRSPEPIPASTPRPEYPKPNMKLGKCFHLDRSQCPTKELRCDTVDPTSVFCCDVDSFTLREGLTAYMKQNITYLHVLNATITELDLSQSVFRRLVSMALTDGNIGQIVGQFPKHSSIACLNISNNNLTTAKLPTTMRPFAYLFNLTVLDASANNLTEFPLSLVQSNRKISIDMSGRLECDIQGDSGDMSRINPTDSIVYKLLSRTSIGNNHMPCTEFHTAMDSNSSLVTFLNYNNTYCARYLHLNEQQWWNELQIVPIEHLKIQKELTTICRNIKPLHANCTCSLVRLELTHLEYMVTVDCTRRGLKEMPTELPPNTVKLNVSYNSITSLEAVGDDPSYEYLKQLIVDNNDIENLGPLEGTKFADNFMLFSIKHNKLKNIHTYMLSNMLETTGAYDSFLIGGNYIHCDCNTEKVLKPWLIEVSKTVLDYKELWCEDGMGPVVELKEFQVCHTPRDWTDYIYYIITLEVLVLVLLISKVSYDYWIFKTAGYLPWPANKMPRLPCDWLCE